MLLFTIQLSAARSISVGSATDGVDAAELALDGRLLSSDETDAYAFASSCTLSPINFAASPFSSFRCPLSYHFLSSPLLRIGIRSSICLLRLVIGYIRIGGANPSQNKHSLNGRRSSNEHVTNAGREAGIEQPKRKTLNITPCASIEESLEIAVADSLIILARTNTIH